MGLEAEDLLALLAFDQGQLSENASIELFQRLIDSGAVWHMAGFYGRTAGWLIEEGMCMYGPVGHIGYWGNYIPSRHEVEAGQPGSKAFVLDKRERGNCTNH